MPTVVVPASVPPRQVDVPEVIKDEKGTEKVLQRSCVGSLHIRPMTQLELTQDELDYLREKESKLFAVLIPIRQERSVLKDRIDKDPALKSKAEERAKKRARRMEVEKNPSSNAEDGTFELPEEPSSKKKPTK